MARCGTAPLMLSVFSHPKVPPKGVLVGLLQRDITRILVLAQSEERRMPKKLVTCPAAELHLCDQVRPHGANAPRISAG